MIRFIQNSLKVNYGILKVFPMLMNEETTQKQGFLSKNLFAISFKNIYF